MHCMNVWMEEYQNWTVKPFEAKKSTIQVQTFFHLWLLFVFHEGIVVPLLSGGFKLPPYPCFPLLTAEVALCLFMQIQLCQYPQLQAHCWAHRPRVCPSEIAHLCVNSLFKWEDVFMLLSEAKIHHSAVEDKRGKCSQEAKLNNEAV